MALVALGCRVSRADVDALAGELRGGFEIAREGERADLVVVNTCALTSDAESAARQAIRRAAREHPGARIVAAGCCAEVRPESLARLPRVAAVVGARSGESVAAVVAGLGGVPAVLASAGLAGFAAGPARHTRPFLKVQDGCDRRCAFCVVPAARGPSRSLPQEEALRRLALLGERHHEVVLTGVHLGGYGRDLAPRSSLEALVREAARRRLVRRLRLSSIEPGEVPLRLLRDPGAEGVLCEHFHLPLQSGSARVLRAMRRPGSARRFRRAVEAIAAAAPAACIGTDVLAGFPGESDADHRETVALLEPLPLAHLHVFPFSPRPGTPAADMPGAVPSRVVKERVRELLELSDRKWRAYLAAQVGRELEVVVERTAGGVARGTAGNYVTVGWPLAGERRGEAARVRVVGADGEECVGVRA
ncbi:MAG TPA: MiaB/RimO family radical SAM methylthiotransferase [Anaeromyxobacter sp.]